MQPQSKMRRLCWRRSFPRCTWVRIRLDSSRRMKPPTWKPWGTGSISVYGHEPSLSESRPALCPPLPWQPVQVAVLCHQGVRRIYWPAPAPPQHQTWSQPPPMKHRLLWRYISERFSLHDIAFYWLGTLVTQEWRSNRLLRLRSLPGLLQQIHTKFY